MLILIICLAALMFAVITDLKSREVPDWLSFGCIFAGLGIAAVNSIMLKSWLFLLNSIAGLALGVVLGLVMYYAGQWGGGDSKLLMGMGALLGLEIFPFNVLNLFNSFLISFIVNIMLVGSIYGLLWVMFLAFKNRKQVIQQFKNIRNSREFTKLRWVFFALLLAIVLMMVFLPNTLMKYYLIGIVLFGFLLSYIWVFVKAVEDLSMVKKVPVEKLTEGDWIYKDVKVNGKRICGPKDLGITKKQIKKLLALKKKKKIRHVTVKEGIPFVPSFLLAFILAMFFGNILVLWLL